MTPHSNKQYVVKMCALRHHAHQADTIPREIIKYKTDRINIAGSD